MEDRCKVCGEAESSSPAWVGTHKFGPTTHAFDPVRVPDACRVCGRPIHHGFAVERDRTRCDSCRRGRRGSRGEGER